MSVANSSVSSDGGIQTGLLAIPKGRLKLPHGCGRSTLRTSYSVTRTRRSLLRRRLKVRWRRRSRRVSESHGRSVAPQLTVSSGPLVRKALSAFFSAFLRGRGHCFLHYSSTPRDTNGCLTSSLDDLTRRYSCGSSFLSRLHSCCASGSGTGG